MVEMDIAFQLLDQAAKSIPQTVIERTIDNCLGYVLAEDIISHDNIPPFRASIMDGYALKHSEYTQNRSFTQFDAKSLAGVSDTELEAYQYNP